MEILNRKITDLEFRGDGETIVATLCSEEPVQRHFGPEVLDHGNGSVDFSRAKDGLPLLWGHDQDQVVGRAERVRLVNRKLKADLRPGSSARAREIWEDIRAGILTDLSIGYSYPDSAVRRDGDVFRVVGWTPHETSVVGVAADPRAKIGRSADLKLENHVEDKSIITNNEPGGERRVRDILSLGKGFNGRFMPDALQAIEAGDSVEKFRNFMLSKLDNTVPLSTPLVNWENGGTLGLTRRETQKYSFTRALTALVTKDFSGAGFELECSRAAEKLHGRRGVGFLVPPEILTRTLSSLSDPAGGFLVGTDHIGSQFIEMLRPRTQVINLGARVITGLKGNVDIPKQGSAGTAYWVAEDGAITVSDQSFESIAMSPKTVGAITRVTRRMLLQADPSVESIVQGDLVSVVGIAIDGVAINGGGSNQPLGVLQTANIAPITSSGTLSYLKLLEFPGAVEAADADGGRLAWLVRPETKAVLLGTPKETAYPVYCWEYNGQGDGQIAGYRAVTSSNVPNNLGVGENKKAVLFGDFSQILIAHWGVLDVAVDPYGSTDFEKGAIRIRVLMDLDVAVRHPAAFAVAVDV